MSISKNILIILFSIILSLLPNKSIANNNFEWPFGKENKKKKTKFSVNKYGTLIGIQRGKFFNFELGIEQQKKQIKLIKPNTLAWSFNMEYAWESNTLGYKLGGWFKTGRLGFTYGANAVGSTNFNQYNFGVAPTLGFKLMGFHIITSYNAFLFDTPEYDYNTMHLSIRYFLSRKRKYKKN